MTDELKKAFQKSMQYLARCEYSRFDIFQKLRRLEFSDAVIHATLDRLQADNLQSDTRFTEQYLRMRSQRGYGPERIRQALENRDISSSIITTAFHEADINWLALSLSTRVKKFGEAWPEDYAEQCRQKRFLQYRGFNSEHIRFACQASQNA